MLVYSRQDGGGATTGYINGAKVWVGDGNPKHWHLCGTIFYRDKKSVYPVSCEGTSGTYVRITNKKGYLQLSEVQVFGKYKLE